ncbi:hypothetical protein QC764_0001910 [Podospora pseudoanserina]|uniref:Uncharacterized protein n=1 Tax=Podospora pseudoanserina TaxID=2609844 RepID=A0ABR0IJZ5_9PEZI|nr:hypothetical protein QC764_0001910 [Podospora pseudoanserina]
MVKPNCFTALLTMTVLTTAAPAPAADAEEVNVPSDWNNVISSIRNQTAWSCTWYDPTDMATAKVGLIPTKKMPISLMATASSMTASTLGAVIESAEA